MSSMLGSVAFIPQAFLLGIPPEVRIRIFQHLFTGVTLQTWYDHPDGYWAYMDQHAIAVTSTCRLLRTETLSILLESLQLIFEWFPGCNARSQIHPSIKEFVLSHLRHLTFTRSELKLTVPIDEHRSIATCLKVVDLGSTTISLRLSMLQMYYAAVNKLLAWPLQSSPGVTATWSFNRYLMTVTLSCCLTAGDSGHYGTSPWLRPLLADKSRKFSLIGRVCGGCIDEQGRYLEIHLTFDLDTFAVLDRYVSHGPFPIMLNTVHDSRVCMFGKRHSVLKGESAEQAEIEGRKLLADLRDSS